MDYKLINVPQPNRAGKLLNVAYQRLKMDHKTFLSLMDFVQCQGRVSFFYLDFVKVQRKVQK